MWLPTSLLACWAAAHGLTCLAGCGAAQSVAVINPGFSMHSLQMSQRYVVLASSCTTPVACAGCDATYIAYVQCICIIPASASVTPPGDYMLTFLDGKVPSHGQWISIG